MTSEADGSPGLTHTAMSPAASPSETTGVVSVTGVAATTAVSSSPSAFPVGPKAPAARARTTANSAPLRRSTRRSRPPASAQTARIGPGRPADAAGADASAATEARLSRKPSGVSSERTRTVHCDVATPSASPPGTRPTRRVLRRCRRDSRSPRLCSPRSKTRTSTLSRSGTGTNPALSPTTTKPDSRRAAASPIRKIGLGSSSQILVAWGRLVKPPSVAPSMGTIESSRRRGSQR